MCTCCLLDALFHNVEMLNDVSGGQFVRTSDFRVFLVKCDWFDLEHFLSLTSQIGATIA